MATILRAEVCMVYLYICHTYIKIKKTVLHTSSLSSSVTILITYHIFLRLSLVIVYFGNFTEWKEDFNALSGGEDKFITKEDLEKYIHLMKVITYHHIFWQLVLILKARHQRILVLYKG